MRNLLKSKQFHIGLGVAISAALIYWVCKGIDWTRVSGEFKSARYWILIPALAMLLLQISLRAIRWRYLLEDGRKLPFGKLFDSIILGSFATYILPLRAGEFVRPFVLSRESEVTFGR